MAVTAVILPFFVPAAFNRRNTNMEEPKSTAKRGAKTAAAAQEDKITLLPLSELHDFPNHPFKVRDDEAMQETTESIRQYGVLVPAIVRPREDGGYEIIAGHRRRHGSELAGLSAMPCIVRQMDDDTATILMVDSNIQRENILPSERAQAYKMKLEAIKRQGTRHDLTSDQLGQKLSGKTSREVIAENSNDSPTQIQRYIRLTELSPELQQMVDEKKIGMTPAVEISYLKPEEQQMLLTAIDSEQATPSLSQAQRMKKLSRDGKLNDDTMLDIMMEQKKPEGYNVVLSADKLRKYFPRSYTPQKMEETILKLLDAWLRKRQRDQSR
jgi:ParB family chromosome partitioning protein